MLRAIFIWLSRLDWAQRLITKSKLASRMALRFVAGDTVEDAVQVIQQLNDQGLMATIDFLGEDTHTLADAEQSTTEIINVFIAIEQAGLRCNVSLKLSQIGLILDEHVCRENLRKILHKAREVQNFVRIDMEDASLTHATLAVYQWAFSEGFSNVGIVLQAYLYRTESDIRNMVNPKTAFRLCKGAYKESATLAFPKKSDVDLNFDHLVRLLLERSSQAGFPRLSENARIPGIPAIATHDEKRIDHAVRLMEEMQVPRNAVEFQMLYGIRRELQRSLLEREFWVRIYVPYGTHWYRYFMRRLAERPANLWFMISNLFKK